jgi:hypothetical protein
MARRVLLVCGILSQLLYAAMNIIAPLLFEGYSVVVLALALLRKSSQATGSEGS